jgi:hypothetical protein
MSAEVMHEPKLRALAESTPIFGYLLTHVLAVSALHSVVRMPLGVRADSDWA